MSKVTRILDGAYEVLGLIPGKVGWLHGIVDLSKITEPEAEKLVRENFPYLRKAKTKPAKSGKAK